MWKLLRLHYPPSSPATTMQFYSYHNALLRPQCSSPSTMQRGIRAVQGESTTNHLIPHRDCATPRTHTSHPNTTPLTHTTPCTDTTPRTHTTALFCAALDIIANMWCWVAWHTSISEHSVAYQSIAVEVVGRSRGAQSHTPGLIPCRRVKQQENSSRAQQQSETAEPLTLFSNSAVQCRVWLW